MKDVRILCKSQTQQDEVFKYGKKLGLTSLLKDSCVFYTGLPVFALYREAKQMGREGEFGNSMSFEQFKQQYMKEKQTFEVDKEFIIQAHEAACDSWKAKLKKKFPDVWPKSIIERIQSFSDVLETLGEAPIPYKEGLSKEQKALSAMGCLFKIVKVYNEGWEPDWNNSSQYKYYPYLYKNSDGSWVVSVLCFCSFLYFPSGLFFKSSALATDAITKFRDLYNDYLMVS